MKIVAIIGTYRKGGIIDLAVDEILSAAREQGAETQKIYLIDRHIEFCTNCRACTLQPGETRGQCPTQDDTSGILDQIEQADAFVLASPMNFWTVTAVTKRFIERLVCYAYWPWGTGAPKARRKGGTKTAVLVASSAAPAIMARPMTRMIGLMKSTATLLGARKKHVLFIGLAAMKQNQHLSPRTRKKARRLGQKIARAT